MGSRQLTAGQARDYLTFRVGEQWYAVDVLVVFEVANMVAISPVPDMPPAVRGMVNVRGTIVPVVDLRIRFNCPVRDMELTTPIIFLHQEHICTYGIIVDDVDDVLTLYPGDITQSSIQTRAPHIVGVVDHKGRLIMLLDTQILLSSTLKDEVLEVLTQSSKQLNEKN